MTDTPEETEQTVACDQRSSAWHVARFCRQAANLDDAFALVFQALERARQDERGRCAQIADRAEKSWAGNYSNTATAREIAQAIRSDGGNGDG